MHDVWPNYSSGESVMRVLVAIPHFFQASNDSAYLQARLNALTTCIVTLHQQFAQPQCAFDLESRAVRPANTLSADQINVIVCTTGEHHLLDRLPLARGLFQRRATSVEPELLGFECHQMLQRQIKRHDYLCYLEDDLIVRDPWFFLKLSWFGREAGEECVLLPNRYEVAVNGLVRKAYVDAELSSEVTAPFQDVTRHPRLRCHLLGQSIEFVRPTNPYSGCFFLTARQMERWAATPWFRDRGTPFLGARESAAALGLMRTFRLYKPAEVCAAFLEVERLGGCEFRR